MKVKAQALMGEDQHGGPSQGPRPISRILVAMDASPHSRAAMSAAVELAAYLGADVVGVFVEDIDLIRVARLRVTVEVGRTSGRVRRVDRRRITYGLRSQADRARRALERAAERWGVAWEFKVLRGSIERELLAASATADLVILGRVGWSEKRVLGSTAEAVLTAAPERTLLLDSQQRLQATLMVIYDGSEPSKRALDTALHVARRSDRYLTVGVVAGDETEARRLQSQAAERIRAAEAEARFRWLIGMDSGALGEMIRSQEGCVLVLPGESPLLADQDLREAIAEFDCPVLVVR